MALTPEQIDRLIQQADGLAPKEGSIFRALVKLTESEVSAQDTALIRQLAEAIKMDRIDWEDWPDDSRTAFEKIRARLLDSDLAKLTERGAKAWAGVDAQDLRDGGKP